MNFLPLRSVFIGVFTDICFVINSHIARISISTKFSHIHEESEEERESERAKEQKCRQKNERKGLFEVGDNYNEPNVRAAAAIPNEPKIVDTGNRMKLKSDNFCGS